MKKPYLLEPKLQSRVIQFLDNHYDADAEETVEYLVNTFKEYRRKSRKGFTISVNKAYKYAMYLKNGDTESNYDEIDIEDDDGGGPDLEIMEEESTPVRNMNSMLTSMYKKKNENTPNKPEVNGLKNGDVSSNTPPAMENVKKKRKNADGTSVIPTPKKKTKNIFNIQNPHLSIDDLLVKSDAIVEAHADAVLYLTCTEDEISSFLLESSKTLLVTGCTGSGKSSFIKAIAGDSQKNLLTINAGEIVADPDLNLKEILDQALTHSPCILHIDKLENVVHKDISKAPEKKFINQLTLSIKGINESPETKPIIVILECSKPELLDWNLRTLFTREVFMPIPSEKDRFKIIERFTDKSSISEEESILLAQKTLSFVVGDIKNLLDKAKLIRQSRLYRNVFKQNSHLNYSNIIKEYKDYLKRCQEEQKEDILIKFEDINNAIKHIVPALKTEMFPTIPDVRMKDVGSLEDIKMNLQELIIDPIMNKELYEKYNARRPTGILMWGPPGCGKTLLAQAIANIACLNMLPVSGPQILNMYQGESERAIRDIFQKAKTVAPCIIFFDEFDAICPARSGRSESGSKTTVVNTLLAEMNGITERKDVYVIATTNRPDMLDPAITRPGRFDTTLYVGLPDQEGRISILKALTKGGTLPKLELNVDLNEIAKMTTNFSGADLNWLIYLASQNAIKAYKAHYRDINQDMDCSDLTGDFTLSMQNFQKALEKVQPSISEKQRQHYDRLKKKITASKRFIEVTDGTGDAET